MAEFDGAVHRHAEVRVGPNWKDETVVELRFTYMNQHTDDLRAGHRQVVVIDLTTASRLCEQLSRELKIGESK